MVVWELLEISLESQRHQDQSSCFLHSFDLYCCSLPPLFKMADVRTCLLGRCISFQCCPGLGLLSLLCGAWFSSKKEN